MKNNKGHAILHHLQKGAILTPFLVAGVILVMVRRGVVTVFEPHFLVSILNSIFLGIIPLMVAIHAARAFLTGGEPRLLSLSMGAWGLGLGGLLSAKIFLLTAGHPNALVTVYNSGALLGGLGHFLGFQRYPLSVMSRANRFQLAVICFGVLTGTMLLVLTAVFLEITPAFIIQGVGQTPLGQSVLGGAILFFALSGFSCRRVHHVFPSLFLNWYSTGLLLIALGLVAVFLQKAMGSPLGWTGRISQYIGGLCFFTGLLGLPGREKAKLLAAGQSIALAFSHTGKGVHFLAELSPDAIILVDNQNLILLWNPAAERIFGYKQEEVLGERFSELALAEPDVAFKAFFREEAAESSGARYEAVLRNRSGHTFPSEISSAFHYNEDGGIQLFMIRDITERTQAEESVRLAYVDLEKRVQSRTAELSAVNAALREEIRARERAESELEKNVEQLQRILRELAIILETAPIGITMIADRKLLWVNQKTCNIFNFPREELVNQTTRKLYQSQEDYERLGRDAYPALARGEIFMTEQTMLRQDGARILVKYIGKAIAPPDLAQGVIWILEDITQRRQTEKALVELNRTLEARILEEVEKNRAKDQLFHLQNRHAALGEMIGNIAHQWRQPLNNLGLIIQSMAMDFSEGELTAETMSKRTADCMTVIKYMSQTIDDFRNFFRQDKAPATFSAADAVHKALDFLGSSLSHNNIEVRIDAKDDAMITGFQNEFTQVLVNILNNAKDILVERKVTNPLITLRVFPEDGKSVVTIHDNGGGIPETIIERIFDPYFTTKEQGSGTGIGLYMSKAIIEKNMNGILSSTNAEGGALFRIEVKHAL